MSTSKAPGAKASFGYDFVKTRHNDTYPLVDSSKANVSGKHVLITGASRGIGRAISISFARAGASSIAITARSDCADTAAAMRTAAQAVGRPEPKVLVLKTDVTNKDSVAAMAAAITTSFGYLDIVINNAGVSEVWAPLAELDPDTWWWTMEANVKGPYLVSRAALPLLRADASLKTIVNVGSIGQNFTMEGASAYQISKLAVARLTEFLDLECSKDGVLAYTIHPGGVLTDMARTGMPKDKHHLLTDAPELAGDSLVFLAKERREWLAGRYIDVCWDMDELLALRDEVVQRDLLKVRMAVGGGRNDE